MLTLPIHCSDHSPLILDTRWDFGSKGRPKRFEEMWLYCDEVSQITKKVWNIQFSSSAAFKLVQKQKALLRHLCNWSNLWIKSFQRKLENTKVKLNEIQCKLADFSCSGMECGSELVLEEQNLRRSLDNMVEYQEIYWAQQAKERRLKLGDLNTKFFHKAASIRAR